MLLLQQRYSKLETELPAFGGTSKVCPTCESLLQKKGPEFIHNVIAREYQSTSTGDAKCTAAV